MLPSIKRCNRNWYILLTDAAMETKAALRQTYQLIRRNLKPAYRKQAMELAAQHFLQFPLLAKNKFIACYLPAPEEFDSTAIIETIWAKKCNCYLPIIKEDNTLQFVLYEQHDPLQANKYGILEPVKREQVVQPQDLDIVITPLVAFDLDGHRLGMGGGYYDKTFAFLHEYYFQKPFFLGLGFAAQQADCLPSDSWDINLDGILTEESLIRVFI